MILIDFLYKYYFFDKSNLFCYLLLGSLVIQELGWQQVDILLFWNIHNSCYYLKAKFSIIRVGQYVCP